MLSRLLLTRIGLGRSKNFASVETPDRRNAGLICCEPGSFERAGEK